MASTDQLTVPGRKKKDDGQSPVIASVTPATAANAAELGFAKPKPTGISNPQALLDGQLPTTPSNARAGISNPQTLLARGPTTAPPGRTAAPAPTPTGYELGRMVPQAASAIASRLNSGVANLADLGVQAYGAGENVVRGMVGAAPNQYPQHPVLGFAARNGLVNVGAPERAKDGAVSAGGTTTPPPTLRQSPTRPSFNAATGGASTTASQATSINGRPLGYGAMVNGVRVFSDGTGGPGAPPATMTKAQIDALANGNRISVADSGIGGNIQSEAFAAGRPGAGVLGRTPELGSAAGYAVTRPAQQQGGVFHMPSQADQAASDIASALNRDTRTPIGLAMRNADVDADGSARGRRGERQRRNEAVVGALADAAKQSAANQGAAAVEGMRNRTDLARAAMDNQGELARAQINRPMPSTIDMADGTLGAVGADGVARPIVGADGKPARRMLARDDSATKRSEDLYDKWNAAAADMLKNSVEIGKQATPEQIAAARLAAAQLNGLAVATSADGQNKLVNINGEWVPL